MSMYIARLCEIPAARAKSSPKTEVNNKSSDCQLRVLLRSSIPGAPALWARLVDSIEISLERRFLRSIAPASVPASSSSLSRGEGAGLEGGGGGGGCLVGAGGRGNAAFWPQLLFVATAFVCLL